MKTAINMILQYLYIRTSRIIIGDYMNKKRVLVISTVNLGFNGITSVIMNYYRNINRDKIQFDFVVCEEIHNSIAEEIKDLGGKVYNLPSRKKRTIKYLKELKKLVKQKNYEIVHLHGNSGTLYLDIHTLKKAGVPMRIVHSHNTTCNYKFIHKILKNSLNREMTDGIACSQVAGDWLFNKDYTIINNGIDIDRFLFNEQIRNEYREKMGVKNKFIIGHIGHFSYQKNHEYLIRVFNEVLKKEPNAILMLIGDGKLRYEIEEQLKELEIEKNVMLLGKRSDISELMQMMDIFVFPSRFEGLPVVLIEAQSAGLNALVSDAITKECQVTERVKFLGLDKDENEWAQEILSLRSVYNRDNVEEKLKKSKFNIKNETKKLEDIYFKY